VMDAKFPNKVNDNVEDYMQNWDVSMILVVFCYDAHGTSLISIELLYPYNHFVSVSIQWSYWTFKMHIFNLSCEWNQSLHDMAFFSFIF
jgi:hypothetical protein